MMGSCHKRKDRKRRSQYDTYKLKSKVVNDHELSPSPLSVAFNTVKTYLKRGMRVRV